MNSKINVGIVGYGNLGKAVEHELLKNSNYNLVAIFSRRLIKSNFNTLVEPYENHINYIGKIDIILLCGGSISDLEIQTPEIAKYFDTINTFDTHAKIKSQLNILNKLTSKHKTRAIISCGWDPGIFSIIRGIMFAVSKTEPITFWGKGISMGHSDALRRVDGVVDGVQFTIPNKDSIRLAKKGLLDDGTPLHTRDCYVVCNKNKEKQIEQQIKEIPNYFFGQPTNVSFVSTKHLAKLKHKMQHKGEIISFFKTAKNNNCSMKFVAKMQSNPYFTAKIMISYLNAIINLKNLGISGAFTPLDLPISFLFNSAQKDKLFALC